MRKRSFIKYTIIPLSIVACIAAAICFFIFAALHAYQPVAAPDIHIPDRYAIGKLLILVPHQDDDANLVSGVLETFASQNEVYIAFSTNGDYEKGYGDGREQEAIAYAEHHHIPKDHIIYLGYADQYDPSAPLGGRYKHLYNAEMDEPMIAHSGRTMTEGVGDVPCFLPSKTLTRRNFRNDIIELIEGIMPDSMVVIDCDAHPDHRALSLMFEEALNVVLRKHVTYEPLVLKGFAYSTAWAGPRDFYSYNLPSTSAHGFLPNATDKRMSEGTWAWWADRIRFPVSASATDEDLTRNSQFIGFKIYANQHPVFGRVIDGDRVFWWRPTNNVLRDAIITCSSGDSSALTDFKLSDSADVTASPMPTHHGWYPDAGRGSITVIFPNPRPIREIRLYDDTDLNNRVLEARITLSNGKTYTVTDIDEGGVAKKVMTDCDEPINGFTIEITKGVGTCGFAEVEAYTNSPQLPFRIIKLTDEKGNFIYNHHTDICGNASVFLWSTPGTETEACTLNTASSSAEIQQQGEGEWKIHVPYGESATIKVYNAESELVDEVCIRHLTIMQRIGRYAHLQRDYLKWDYSQYIDAKIATYKRKFSRLFSKFTLGSN